MKKFLSLILYVSGLMPLFVGITALTNYTKVPEMFKITAGEGSFELVTIIGACMIPLAIIQFVAGYWTWKGDWHGIVFARILGLMILFDGIVLYSILHRMDMAGIDMVKGSLMLVLAMLIRKPRN